MKNVKFKIIGEAPLLQHNVRLANPLDPLAKEIGAVAKKRSKTDADHALLAQLEFKAGIYFDDKVGPYVPATWIDRALENSGKREKLGSTLKAYARVVEDRLVLAYDGPRTLEGLWKENFHLTTAVGIQQRKTMRTRPCFKEWSLECTILYDEAALDEAQIVRTMERAGAAIGIGDYRPRYGRFICEVA